MSTKASIVNRQDASEPDALEQGSHSQTASKTHGQADSIRYNVILGCPRSGTTFLFDALQALPYSEASSGHLFPLSLAHIVNQPISPEIYQCLLRSFQFSINDFLEAIGNSRVRSLHKWLTGSMTTPALWQRLQRTRQIERFVYKEPFLSFAPEFVYEALPAGRIVHIYRDGRDCADSLMRKYKVLSDQKLTSLHTAEMPLGRKYDHRYVPWWVETGSEQAFLDQTPFVRSIWMWREMVRRCHEVFSQPEVVASNRVLLVKYEDLVTDPMKYGEVVVNHFGCTMNDQLRKKFQGARRSSIGVYRRRDAAEIAAAEQIAGAELALYGYL